MKLEKEVRKTIEILRKEKERVVWQYERAITCLEELCQSKESETTSTKQISIMECVQEIIEKRLGNGLLGSIRLVDVKMDLKDDYGREVIRSTIRTCLTRLVEKKILEKINSDSYRKYVEKKICLEN